MHSAVELILTRMDTHPEEFVGTKQMGSRWFTILSRLEDFAKAEEWAQVAKRLNDIRMDKLREDILKEICNPQPEQLELPLVKTVVPQSRWGGADNVSLGGYKISGI